MPNFNNEELNLIKCACSCLWDSLDIANTELRYRYNDIYEQNKQDMKVLINIINKIKEIK